MPASDTFRVLIIGDIVGRPGRDAVTAAVPELRASLGLDLVVANAENSASGSGITPRLFREIQRAGVDVMTLGDHAWKRRDNLDVLRKEERLLRPGNYPDEAMGKGALVFDAPDGTRVGLITVLGRIFMDPVACPFRTIDKALESFPDDVKIRIVEIHAEATSEKISVGWHLDGRVSCVFGTHTHVPTADDRILPGGTAYITDIGMTGPYDGVIGRETSAVLHKFLTSMHATFRVADGNARVCGIVVDIDRATGQAAKIRRVDVPVELEGSPGGGVPAAPLHRTEGDA